MCRALGQRLLLIQSRRSDTSGANDEPTGNGGLLGEAPLGRRQQQRLHRVPCLDQRQAPLPQLACCPRRAAFVRCPAGFRTRVRQPDTIASELADS
jgi:hypothetical protein